MKYIVAILFFVAVSFAQEMDTTYVVNEFGQTVGYIHEKGTPVKVAPAPMVNQAPAPWASLQTQHTAQDSLRKMEKLRDVYYARGGQLSARGNGFVVGGSVGVGVGLLMFIVGFSNMSDDDSDSEYEDDDVNVGYFFMGFAGYAVTIVGGLCLTAGIISKIVGSSKIRKGDRLDWRIKQYQEKMKVTDIRFIPTYNIRTGAVGGNLALNF